VITLLTWNAGFLTHLPSVDAQHRQLVHLVNAFVSQLVEEDQDEEAAVAILEELAASAGSHFEEEEQLMEDVGLDARFLEVQRTAHRLFAARLVRVLGHRPAGYHLLQDLAQFLVEWLQRHIIHLDQGITRQIHLIEAGLSPSAAYEEEAGLDLSAPEPAAQIVGSLLAVVHQKNRELREASVQVEELVELRTEELVKTNESLHSLATHDELTGLANRRMAVSVLNQRLAEYQRSASVFSVLLLDLDQFKGVNDQFGHQEGDAVLQAVARHLTRTVRQTDLVCRLGGDEFLVICPLCDEVDGLAVAEKLVRESHPTWDPQGRQSWNGSISVGVAEVGQATTGVDQLLAQADRALYASKRRGGGTVSGASTVG
jgi:hemerythrin